jgi:hypothetical protein
MPKANNMTNITTTNNITNITITKTTFTVSGKLVLGFESESDKEKIKEEIAKEINKFINNFDCNELVPNFKSNTTNIISNKKPSSDTFVIIM